MTERIEIDDYDDLACPTCKLLIYDRECSDLHFCEHVLFVIHMDGIEYIHEMYSECEEYIELLCSPGSDIESTAEIMMTKVSNGLFVILGAHDRFDAPSYIGMKREK